jgi:UDP-N-acetylmuramoyl-tripeptide--D-alanyl-D-alanine ligase
MNLQQLYNLYIQSSGICTDTRKIELGCMFFALKGETFDGNLFAEKALRLGSAIVVVDNKDIANQIGEKAIYVEDSLLALQQLSHFHRKQFRFPIISMTGSNGKTTTKELTLSVLSQKYNVIATQGNLNNHIGVPLTLLSMPLDLDFGIVEMGANHVGEIELLCKIAEPDFVMITNIGKAHLEGFGGVEGIKKGKSEIYRYAADRGKTVFINIEDEVLMDLLPDNVLTITYSPSFLKAEANSEAVSIKWNNKEVLTHIYGDYNLPNIAFAAELGKYFDVSLDQIAQGIVAYTPDNNRSQVKKIGSNTYYLDAYNANPSSMKLSLENFAKLSSNLKYAILGDMLELGEYEDEEHLAVVSLCKELDLCNIMFIGPRFMKIKDGNHFYADVTDAAKVFKSLDLHDHHILLKGSRGIAVEKILEV